MDLEQTQNELESSIGLMELENKKIISFLTSKFSIDNVSPRIHTVSNSSIEFEFSPIFSAQDLGYLECSFRCHTASNEIRITPKLLFQPNSTTSTDIHCYNHSRSVMNLFMVINDKINSLDKTVFLTKLKKYKENLKNLKKQEKELKKVEEEIIRNKNKKTFNAIDRIFPQLNEFCVDSFLCEHFFVEFENGTHYTSKDKEKLANKIKSLKANDMRKKFFIYSQEKNDIKFETVSLCIEPDKGTYYACYQQKTIRSKKQINELMSKQFYYNGSLMDLALAKRTPKFREFAPESFCKTDNNYYYGNFFQVPLVEIQDAFFKEVISENLTGF